MPEEHSSHLDKVLVPAKNRVTNIGINFHSTIMKLLRKYYHPFYL